MPSRLRPDNLSPHYVDLRKSLPSLHSSLSPDNRAAEEFSWQAVGLFAGWLLGFTTLLSIACILWA